MKNVLVNFSYGDKCIESIDGDIFLNSMKKYKTFDKVCFVNQVSEAAQQKLRKYFGYWLEACCNYIGLKLYNNF